MEYMPDELLKEIILKLPMRSVARWKCVCKSWNSYLNSYDFIIQYLQLSNNNKIKHNGSDPDLILRYRPKDDSDDHLDLISIISHETLEVVDTHELSTYTQSIGVKRVSDYIVSCCNGVVCIADRYYDVHMLWNPKTKQVKLLPRISHSSSNILGLYQLVGFGYDDKNNDYKVVSFIGYELGTYSQVYVYSLKLDCWRMVASNVKDSDLYVNVNSVEEVGTDCMCSWLVMTNRVHHQAALSFEMSKEIIILTPFPSFEKRRHACGGITIREICTSQLVDLNGHVAFFDYVQGIICNIWWLGEIGVEDSWTKLFSIQLQHYEMPLGFWKNFGLLLYKFDGGKLVLLDIATYQRKTLQTGIMPAWQIDFNFIGSMAPIN
ncbi:hypothetical protein FNV43_RR06397 [Rhamnella rubrinervis]|uniref:F-box domain-containing protein n=1 Tax=Rhamnella rubrinervis TaxID=2594499 RepID=A0A8K0HCW4_9ROSA|nr:hypothetical protein FNV43_RR06397 [Rhamnella rubrinervis]